MDHEPHDTPATTRARRRAGAAPRRRSVASNLYLRGKTYWFRAQVGGREVRRSLGTDDLNTARVEAARLLRSLRADAPSRLGATWNEVAQAYAQAHLLGPSATVKPSTAASYADRWKQMGEWLDGVPLHRIDRALLMRIIDGCRAKGSSNATINRCLTAISVVMDYALDHGLIDANPVRQIVRKRRTPEAPRIPNLPSDEQVAQLASHAPGAFADLILFLRWTGMRLEEAAGLQWSQVRDGGKEIVLTRTKSGQMRTLSLLPEAVEILARQRRHNRTPWVFWHGDGERYASPSSNFRRVASIARREAEKKGAPLPKHTAHDLRHAFAVGALKSRRMGLYALSRYLGHSTVKITERYLRYLTAEEDQWARGA
jgi:integrase/recombinase XerD